MLVVEDYGDLASIIATLMRNLRHEVRIACSGRQALAHVEAFAPHLILLDIHLPDMLGFEVARAIRARRDGRAPFIAAITGRRSPEDVAESEQVGINRLILKPPTFAQLSDVIALCSSDASEE